MSSSSGWADRAGKAAFASMEEDDSLWLAKGTPRAWLEDGKRIVVQDAPTDFGKVSYAIESHIAQDKMEASVMIPARKAPRDIWLRLRRPEKKKIQSVTMNGKPWTKFDSDKEAVSLRGVKGKAKIIIQY